MRKVVVSEFISLDGVMEDPTWSMPYWNDDIAKFKKDELFSSDALLLGRITYEGFAAAWPGQTDEQGYADRMNSMAKYVVTKTLDKGNWNNSRLIIATVPEQVTRLKELPGQDILIFGSAGLVNSLVPTGLIDEYRLLVYPIVLGKGKRLFADGVDRVLKLADVTKLGPEVVAMTYTP